MNLDLPLVGAIVCLLVVGVTSQYHQKNQHQQGQQHQPQQQQPHHADSFLEKNDFEHIKHDMKDQYYMELDEKTAAEGDLDFYNFKLHDYDGNELLDGLEILIALNHDAEHVPTSGGAPASVQPSLEQQLLKQDKYYQDASVIDQVLSDYDSDGDGFVSFVEYMQVRRKLSRDVLNR